MAAGDDTLLQPGDHVLLREFERTDAVRGFWYEHYAEFLEHYRGKFVAVRDALGDCEVVASNDRIGALVEAIDDMGLERQVLDFKLISDEPRAPLPVLTKRRKG